MMTPVCPYCMKPANLVGGAVIYPHRPDLHNRHFWQCVPCAAYVGCPEGATEPSGTLANEELREARIAAHEALDHLWKIHGYKRGDLYKLMANRIGIRHIAEANLQDCERVRQFANDMLKRIFKEPKPLDISPMLQVLQQRNPHLIPPPPAPPKPKPSKAKRKKKKRRRVNLQGITMLGQGSATC